MAQVALGTVERRVSAFAPLSRLLNETDDVCDICGASMTGLHCKLRCVNCGFIRDCSDP
jgi:hypothetical protein